MSSKENIKQSLTQNYKPKNNPELNKRNKGENLLKLSKKTQNVNSLKKIKINRSIIAISLKEKSDKNNNNKKNKNKIKASNSNTKFSIVNMMNSKKQISYRNNDYLSNKKNPYQSAYVLNKSNKEKNSFNKIIKSIKLGLNSKKKNNIKNFKPNPNSILNDYHRSVNTISNSNANTNTNTNTNKKNKKGHNNSINLVTDYNINHMNIKNNNNNKVSVDKKDIKLNTQRNCSYNNSLIKLSSLKVRADKKKDNKIDNYTSEKENNSVNGKFNLSFTEIKNQNDANSLAVNKEKNKINKKDGSNNNFNLDRNMNNRRLIFQKMNLIKIKKYNINKLSQEKKRMNLSCTNNLRNKNKSLRLSNEELTFQKNKNNNTSDNNINIINNNDKNKISISTSSSNLENQTTENKIFNGKIENYHMSKELGKGSYASVKLATHILTKDKYAIKIYTKCSLLNKQKKNTVKNEINILKQLDHINIMKLYEVIDTEKYLYLVLEYIKGCSLLDLIKKEHDHTLKEKRAINIFNQVVQAIAYCHSKNISHRDIKLENILIKNNDEVKIIDFGFAIKNDTNTYNKLLCGTPSYMSPEIVNKKKYIAQYSEVWTLGILLFVMLYGRFPFKGKNEKDLFMKIKEGDLCLPEDKFISTKVKKLLEKIIVVDPKKRPTAQDIVNYLKLYIL